MSETQTEFLKFFYKLYRSIRIIDRIPLWVCYTLLFVSLLVLEYHNFHLGWDLSVQLNSLVNFANGHGITINSINDSGNLVYEPCSLWPPGFVVFTYPFYLLTGDTVLSAIIVRIVSYLFFIVFLVKYLKFLRIESLKIKLIVIYFIIGILPFIGFYPQDVLATVFCLWGFYYHIKYQINQNNNSLIYSLFFLSMGYFVKYVYLPFMFLPFCASLISRKREFSNKNKLIILSYCFVFSAVIYAVNFFLVGNPSGDIQFDAFKGNPHWNQLSHFDGFLLTVGQFKGVFLNSILGFGFPIQFGKIAALITFLIYAVFFYFFFLKRNAFNNKIFENSLNLSFSAGVLIISFLFFMTINVPAQNWWKNPYWTYVEESRYFGPIIFLGLINYLIIVISKKKYIFLKVILIVLIFINTYCYFLVINKGFYGKNYLAYNEQKNNIMNSIIGSDKRKKTIILYDETSQRYNFYNDFFQTQGYTIMEYNIFLASKININQYNIFFLKKNLEENKFFLIGYKS